MKSQKPDWMNDVPLKCSQAPAPVILSQLSPAVKNQLWHAIKSQKPALAKMLTTDPTVDLILREFNGALALDKKDFDQLMAAEKQNS